MTSNRCLLAVALASAISLHVAAPARAQQPQPEAKEQADKDKDKDKVQLEQDALDPAGNDPAKAPAQSAKGRAKPGEEADKKKWDVNNMPGAKATVNRTPHGPGSRNISTVTRGLSTTRAPQALPAWWPG